MKKLIEEGNFSKKNMVYKYTPLTYDKCKEMFGYLFFGRENKCIFYPTDGNELLCSLCGMSKYLHNLK